MTQAPPTIAFLEDNPSFAANIVQELEQRGFKVHHFNSGYACIAFLENQRVDLCLFDWQLPDLAGPEVMERLTASASMPPVIFLTGRDDEQDITRILLSGADDYIVKPPAMNVLEARMRAILRRSLTSPEATQSETIGHFQVNYSDKTIFHHGSAVPLTGKEMLLALEFFRRRGQIISRDDLNKLLGVEEIAIDTRRLDVHLSRLRSKLELNAQNGWKLSSIYQRGYRLEHLAEN